jgi:acyl phosphate:glycerol-3-phosphate acyltransferase
VLTILAVTAVGYFLGSLPAGYLAGRIAAVDVRTIGSGNVGATNVTRTLGKRFGYPVFLVDFGKGVGAVVVSQIIAKHNQLDADLIDLCAAIAGVAAVIGHSFPVWLGFRGGKGVATTIGVLFGVQWFAGLIVCVVWLLVFQILRYVSLASIAAAVALPLTMTAMYLLNQLNSPILLYFSFCLTAIVILRHRSNLSRLFKGTEPRFTRK